MNCISSSNLLAQSREWVVGGGLQFSFNQISISSDSLPPHNSSSFIFSPQLGYWTSNHFQLGLGATVISSNTYTVLYTQSASYSGSNLQRGIGGLIWGRYFFNTIAFRPFVGLNIEYMRIREESEYPGYSENHTQFNTMTGAQLNAGFLYKLAPRLAVYGALGSLGYQRTTYKAEDSDKKTTDTYFGLDAGSLGDRFTVGMYFTLGKALVD
ncbi:MAG: outer membrane beta-barrel protein [Saprospiraceae bacterium]